MKKSITNWLWPDVSTAEGAIYAARQGFWSAVFLAVIIAMLIVMGAIPWGYVILVVVYAAIAFGIIKMNRMAAIAGLALFALSAILGVVNGGLQASGIILALLLAWGFALGVRGTSAYPKVKDHAKPGKPKA